MRPLINMSPNDARSNLKLKWLTLERINQILRNLVILSITPRSIRLYDNSVLTNFSSDHLGCQGRCNVFQQRLIY
jgi:hypothetical protein